MDAAYQEPTTFGAKELHKRKRTKRQRSQSLSHLPSAVVSDKPARRSDSLEPTGETEDRFCNEEEDMANCLMLLARGGLQIVKNGDEEEDLHGNDQNDPKFSSKRYVEDSGYFVYQCKTCDKSFPSFQALGGHRASHKKPKTDKRPPPPLDFPTAAAARNGAGGICVSDDDDVLALQLMMNNAAIQKPPPVVKVHECSICGAEFSSGQALGGHMRRHRPPPVASSSSLTPPTPESKEPARNKFGSSSSTLDLDLNLPAPEDDQESGSVLSFGSRSGLVLSIPGPAMVGCHY